MWESAKPGHVAWDEDSPSFSVPDCFNLLKHEFEIESLPNSNRYSFTLNSVLDYFEKLIPLKNDILSAILADENPVCFSMYFVVFMREQINTVSQDQDKLVTHVGGIGVGTLSLFAHRIFYNSDELLAEDTSSFEIDDELECLRAFLTTQERWKFDCASAHTERKIFVADNHVRLFFQQHKKRILQEASIDQSKKADEAQIELDLAVDDHNIVELFGGYRKNKETRSTASESLDELNKKRIAQPFTASADPKSVGEMLASVREDRGMTKVAVAKLLDKSESTVRGIETGRYSPNLSTIEDYAKALGYKVRLELIPDTK